MSAWHENPLTATPEIVRLPTADDLKLNLPYSRKIWTCSAPYELNLTTGVCEYKRVSHPCSKSSTGVVRSPYVESDPTVVQTDAGFDRLVNKKLACCINSHEVNSAGSTVGTFIKYDCVQTRESDPSGAPLDFNALWAASDDPLDGGQMNALGLVNSHGQTITGFYSLKGSRCPLFSEFAGDLTPMRVRPFISANQQNQVTSTTGIEPLGSSFPLPTSASYLALRSALLARTPALSVPTTIQQMNECPVLVRAALVARCPTYSSSLPFVSVRDPSLTTLVRCPVAASLMIHLRIEQLYEIAGSAPLKRFDTRASKDQIASLDVAELIASKTGNSCWPGTHKEGDICVY
jgi:hypothetical protein